MTTMGKIMTKIKWFIVLSIPLCLVIWIGYIKITEWKVNKDECIQSDIEQEKRLKNTEMLVNQISSKYNAISNWDDLLSDSRVYSIEVEKALKPENNSPILIISRVQDIIRKDDKEFVKFLFYSKSVNFIFSLECSHGQISQILWHKSERFAKYAVIAHIISVNKGEHSNGEGKLEECFFADGQCVDLVYLEEGSLFNFLKIIPKPLKK